MNEQTWRDALTEDESRFVALILDDESNPVEAIEVDRHWTNPSITHGRDTLRSMLSALHQTHTSERTT